MISYARQSISRRDRAAVAAVLASDYLTQGPAVAEFEAAVADYCGARHAVAVSSGTAALHLACLALGLRAGDRHWTSPVSFVASANCGVYCGAQPDFVEIDPLTWNMSVSALADKLAAAARKKQLPRVIIPVHLAGRPCDMPAIRALAKRYGCRVLEDASHAIGAEYHAGRRWRRVGACAHSDAAVFSFHAVKHITTGEGGMVVTNDRRLAERVRQLRTHGITRDARQLRRKGQMPFYYEMQELGYNYRITDMQCALGVSQLAQLPQFLAARRRQAARYAAALAGLPGLRLPDACADARSAWHLFIVRSARRDALYRHLRRRGIIGNLHYLPIYRQPYYQDNYRFRPNDFSQTECYAAEALTLPLYPGLSRAQQEQVIDAVREFHER